MELFWRKSFFGDIELSNISSVVGTIKISSSRSKIDGLQLYTEQNSQSETLIISQDSLYNRTVAVYEREQKYLGLVSNVTITINNKILKFIHESRSSAYLELDNKIIASYRNDNGWLNQTGSITIYDYKDQWPMLIYGLFYAVKCEDDRNASS